MATGGGLEQSEPLHSLLDYFYGHVAELVYAYVSEAYGVTLGSSSLPMPTVYSTPSFLAKP
jgi:hypothetical protein